MDAVSTIVFGWALCFICIRAASSFLQPSTRLTGKQTAACITAGVVLYFLFTAAIYLLWVNR